MFYSIPLLGLAFASFLFSGSAEAATLYTDTDRITANVSDDNGQLIDWSNTDRKIEAIYLDNPGRFRQDFVFTADGCNKERCVNATAISISAIRQGGNKRAVMKVRLVNSKGKRSILVINVEKVPYNSDGVITFAPPPEVLPARISSPSSLFQSVK